MVHSDFTNGATAGDLRLRIVDRHFQTMSQQEADASRTAQMLADRAFLVRHRSLDADDFSEIVKRIYLAAEAGRCDLTVMQFQAALCSDRGRAIANGAPDWVDTLPLRARSYYDHWATTERTLGYHLKAMILDYPNGMPGEVGLVLDWRATQLH